MSNQAIIEKFSILLADTYTLSLKTQNYHWHVRGPNFHSIHSMLDSQYHDLAIAVDDIAERIRALGAKAPATFTEFELLKTINSGDSSKTCNEMICELYDDHLRLIQDLRNVLAVAQDTGDEGSITLIGERITHHEKVAWILESTKE